MITAQPVQKSLGYRTLFTNRQAEKKEA